MKKTIFALMLAVMPLVGATAQTYTNSYSKEVNRLAEKWAKKGEWRTFSTEKGDRFTKAAPAPTVNLAEFYLQYQKNPEQWKAVFRWLQETDLLTIPAGRTPIPGTTLTASVEDGDNWCSQDDLKAGKGSESHIGIS